MPLAFELVDVSIKTKCVKKRKEFIGSCGFVMKLNEVIGHMYNILKYDAIVR